MKTLVSLALLLAAWPAEAGLTLALTPAIEPGAPNQQVIFFGTISNANASGNLYLNDLQLSFNGGGGAYLSVQPNVFFANVPGILLPGENYSDLLFGVSVSPTTPLTTYSGTVSIQGGTDIFASSTLASQTFQVSLVPLLTVNRSGNNVVLSWPASPPNFGLQQNPTLATTNWLAVTNGPTLQNGQYQFIISPSSPNQFYRLQGQ